MKTFYYPPPPPLHDVLSCVCLQIKLHVFFLLSQNKSSSHAPIHTETLQLQAGFLSGTIGLFQMKLRGIEMKSELMTLNTDEICSTSQGFIVTAAKVGDHEL